MKKLLAILTIALAINACQRGVDDLSLRPQGTDSSGTRLKKQVITDLADNRDYFTAEFSYDDAGHLSQRQNVAKILKPAGIVTQEGLIKYHRDAQGRISKIEYPVSTMYPDTLNVLVEYQDATSKKVSRLYDDKDKLVIAYEYNSDGRVYRINYFQHFPLPTDPMKMIIYHVHNYDSRGNLLEKIYYQDDDRDGVFAPAITFRFEYDNKVNPFYPVDDALFPDSWSFVSPNNTVKQQNITPHPPLPGDTIRYVYEYNSADRPVRSWQNNTSLTKYFYE